MLVIRKMDRMLNPQIRELCVMLKGINEKIDKSVLRWFGHIERMENDNLNC